MGEQEIAAKLQANIPKDASYQPPAPDPGVTGEPAFQSSVSLGDPVISNQLQDYFEFNRADKYSEDRQRQLQTVLEWASAKAQSNDIMEILRQIQLKELEIGHRPFQDRLKTLYRLAKIEAQTNFLELERQMIYGAE